MSRYGVRTVGLALALAVGCSVVNAPDDPKREGEEGGGGSAACELGTVEHCSACGDACAPENVDEATCEDSECGYTSCKNGFQDCDGDRTNGCESAKQADAMNCGSCGADCAAAPFANVVEKICQAGTCGWTECADGYGDCNDAVGDGCELALDTVDHCGGCLVACDMAQNVTTQACTATECGYDACLPGFDDCDGNTANGCETDILTTEAHCGGCNQPCNPPLSCGNGMCQVCFPGDTPSMGGCLLASVCGLPPVQHFCGGNCSNNHDQFAQWWCQLAGYSMALNYTVESSGVVTCYYYNLGSGMLSQCSEVTGPAGYGLDPNCTAVTNLVCAP
jgi:hypothetical protein